jgi:hypothetical protein
VVIMLALIIDLTLLPALLIKFSSDADNKKVVNS